MEKQNFQQTIIEAAWSSSSFKKELIESPIPTLEKVTGEKFPVDKINVVVEDQSDINCIYLNIPFRNTNDSKELSADDLDEIVGGGGCGCSDNVWNAIGYYLGAVADQFQDFANAYANQYN